VSAPAGYARRVGFFCDELPMRAPVPRSLASVAVAGLLLSACASIDDATPARPIQPLPGLGASGFEVTARDAQARAWFIHGLLLTYAFEHEEAARVFRAALARDPGCAMCAWGVAYALGPNINRPDRGPVREIRRFIARAQQAAAGVTARERALIDAMAVRYGAADERAQKTYEALGTALCSTRLPGYRPDPKELAYAAAMADVVGRFPDDPDIVALHADAVMSTMPWNWWDPKTGRPNGQVAELIGRLASAARAHPRHPGVLHLFVHLAEHSPDPRQAEAAADALGEVAPAAPHLVHMGSHIYKNIGRFADGTRANERALQVQRRFDAALAAQGGLGAGKWDAHHLHFLWYSALMEGRTELSRATALDYARRYGEMGDGFAEYAQLLPLATLVRLQRWDAVLAEPAPPPGLGLLEGYDAYARGMAHAHEGRLAQARAELARLERLGAQPTLQRATFHGAPMPAMMVALARDLLAGTVARFDGRFDEAIALLRKAADADEALGNDPPLLGGGARLALAGALLQAGRLDEAGREIAEAVRLDGPSAWSHQGLAQLAEVRGAHEDARRHAAAARAAWANADGATLRRL
jgi:tetratricopeptide (TPR) repeat protein